VREQIIRRRQKIITAFLADIEARVAANPELEEVLLELGKALIAKNGHKAVPPRRSKHMYSAGAEAGIESHRDQLPDWFELSELQRLMEEAAFPFNSSDHRKALRDALYRLEKYKGKIKSEHRKGGKTRYKFV
jgi:hypothetical protein